MSQLRRTTPERESRKAGDRARSQLRRERKTTRDRELRQAGDRARSQLRRERETTPEEQHCQGDTCREQQQTSPYVHMTQC